MAEPDPYADPYASPTPAVTVQQASQDYGDPAAYKPVLDKYRTAFDQRENERKQVEAKQQLNTDQMSTLLEQAASAIRKNREGRSNLPMMAMGAAMMGPGDFGTQVGRGLQAMVPQIQKQREEADQTEITLSNLGLKAGELRDAPLKTKLDYIKALQLGDMATMRAIEAAQVRASAQQGNKQGALDLNTQKAQAQVLQKASAEASKQVADLKKDNEYTQEEEDALYKNILKQQITLQAGGAGMQLNDEFINKALNMPRPTGGGVSVNAFPKPEEMKAKGEQLGLPDMPPTYQDMPPKERAQLRAKETAGYDVERKKWDEQAGVDKQNDDRLREAQSIIQNNPDLIGTIKGKGWNVSSEAKRLATILEQLRLNSVPKGQGQITDFERRLIEQAGVQLTDNPQSALQTIQAMRDANNRSTEHRAFMENYYRTYRTLEGATGKWEEYTKSNAGSYVTEKDGKLVPNEKRLPSDVYFKWQRKGSPPGLVKNTADGKYYINRDGTMEPL